MLALYKIIMLNSENKITKILKTLENQDKRERDYAVDRELRLRQIQPESGQLLALLISFAPTNGELYEVGTSGGYSALWQAKSLLPQSRKLLSFEIRKTMVELARKNIHSANCDKIIHVIEGDARDYFKRIKKVISWLFLDAENSNYECFCLAAPNLIKNGLIVIDNAITHKSTMKPIISKSKKIFNFSKYLIPIGNGILVLKKQLIN